MIPPRSLPSIESVPALTAPDVLSAATAQDLLPSALCRRLYRLPLVTGPTTTSARLTQLSPVLTVPPFDAVGRRRRSSPGAFLHMIREDEAIRWDIDEGVGDVGRRKTSLGLDDVGSPMQPVCESAWSRKTSATSGYSDTMPGGDSSWTESRKTSLADDDRLGTSPERATCADPTLSQSCEEDIGNRHLVVPGPPVVGPRPSLSVPTFQLVIDDADVTSELHRDISDSSLS